MAEGLRYNAAVPIGRLAASVMAWRAAGRLRVTIIAKATFTLVHDAEMSLASPEKVLRGDIHHGGDPRRSVRTASDMVPYMPRAELLFTGDAHAPGGVAVRTLPVRIGLFDGPRVLIDKGLLVQDAAGFVRMPIVYERAYGGPTCDDNPVGTGAAEGTAEPNILHPRDPLCPAGFGPIARTWPARRRLLGATPPPALEGAVAELPEGFDAAYFHAAPADQRTEILRGDEWIVMDGLHPEMPRLRSRLPGARARARIHGLAAFGTAEGYPLDLAADTLHVGGAAQRCTVTWRASFPVPDETALPAVQVDVGLELPHAPIVWAPRAAVEITSHQQRLNEQTISLRDEPDGAPAPLSLPFLRSVPASGLARPGPARARVATDTLLEEPTLDAAPESLPFLRAADELGGAPPPAPLPTSPAGPPPVPTPAPLAAEAAPPLPEAPSPPPPAPAPPAPAPPVKPAGDPWKVSEPAAHSPSPKAAPRAEPTLPGASSALKKAIYGRFGGKV